MPSPINQKSIKPDVIRLSKTMTPEQIAKELGSTPGSVRVILHRHRKSRGLAASRTDHHRKAEQMLDAKVRKVIEENSKTEAPWSSYSSCALAW